MFRFSLGMSRVDRIRKEYIREKAQAGTKLERRGCGGGVQRTDSGYTGDRMWKRELPGGRERGHAQGLM